MSPAALLSNLTARGIEFQVVGDKLRFRPVELLIPKEVDAVRQHKAGILKLLRAEGQQQAEHHCGKHDRPEHWTYSADRYERPGWQSVHCSLCRKFIGYQPPQQQEADGEEPMNLRQDPEPLWPADLFVIGDASTTSIHEEKNMNDDLTQSHTPEEAWPAKPDCGPTAPDAAPAVEPVAGGVAAAAEAKRTGTPHKPAKTGTGTGTASNTDELDGAIKIAVRPAKRMNGSSIVSGKDKALTLKDMSSLARRLRKLSVPLYDKYSDVMSELMDEIKDL